MYTMDRQRDYLTRLEKSLSSTFALSCLDHGAFLVSMLSESYRPVCH